MRPRRGSGELDGGLRLGLYDLFNPKGFDLETMGFVQLIDHGDLHCITLLYDQGRGQPDLRSIEEHVNQGELFRFSHGYLAGSQDEHRNEHTEPV